MPRRVQAFYYDGNGEIIGIVGAPFFPVAQAPLTPQQYGVKADGVTDDTVNFQKFLNDLPGHGDGYLPPGAYSLGALTFSGSYANIRGSRGVTLRLRNGVNAPLLSTPNDGTQRNGLRLTGFVIDGNAANQTGAAPLLDIYGMDDFYADKMYVVNPRGAGIRLGASGTATCLNPYITDSLFRGDQTNSQGAAVELDSKSSDAHLTGLDIGWFKNEGGLLLSSHYGALIADCDMWQCKFGIHFSASHRTRVSNCLSDYAGSHGFFAQSSNDLQFTNCQARESAQLGSATADGFHFEGVSGTPATDIVLSSSRAMGSWQRYGINFAQYVTRGNAIGSMLSGNLTGPSNIDPSCVSVTVS